MLRMRSVPKQKLTVVYAGEVWTDFPLNILAKTTYNFEPRKVKVIVKLCSSTTEFAPNISASLWVFSRSTSLARTKFIGIV